MSIRVALLVLFFAEVCGVGAWAQPGSIAPNAIRIELGEKDEIHPFSEGFSTVRRGQAFGIIDRKGHFVVPYNKYTSISWFNNGFCKVGSGDPISWGLIDTTGKEVLSCGYQEVTLPSPQGLVCITKAQSSATELLDLRTGFRRPAPERSGVIFTESTMGTRKDLMADFASGLIRVRDLTTKPGEEPRVGFMNAQGHWVVPARFKEAHAFSEGLAAVLAPNEFGELKWGFIDPRGNYVLPLQFTKETGDFHDGRAYVEPKDGADFRCGFIRRDGSLVMKSSSSCPEEKEYLQGLLLLRHCVGRGECTDFAVDTAGHSFKLPATGKYLDEPYIWRYTGRNMDGLIEVDGNIFANDHRMGLMDRTGAIALAPIFFELGAFDPVSGLAKATYDVPGAPKAKGFIDRDGVFRIVVVEASKW